MAAKSKTKAKSKSKSERAPKRPAKKRPVKKKSGWRVKPKSLADVRRQIDKLDAQIVPLLSMRHYFVTQAANFKPSVAGVIVQSRVEEIIGKVRAMAAAWGSSPDTIERVYRGLIDAFTADEQAHWKNLHK